jgi:photosystem II stability/assembly factor-like uncharacterized protein
MAAFKLQILATVLACGLFAAIRPASGQIWTQTSAPITNWQAVACSVDGSKIIGAVATYDSTHINGNKPGPIYLSTNSGITWTHSSAPDAMWQSVACSADGTKLVASVSLGPIYISTDSGITWLMTGAPSNNMFWASMVSSSDGSILAATASSGGIYSSTNSGTSWFLSDAASSITNYWPSIATSANGCNLVAIGNVKVNESFTGSIYASTNSGMTWTLQSNAPVATWLSVASSADGSKLIATTDRSDGRIFTSTNFGANWKQTSVIVPQWKTVVSSADGTKLAAASLGFPLFGSTNEVFFSNDSGVIWSSIGAPPDANSDWDIVALSADGNKLFALANGGIYTWQSTPTPQLYSKRASNDLIFSWLVPSTNFVLQQSSNLCLWVDVTSPPSLNFTNLQYQVTVSPSNQSAFFRLKTP